MKLPAQQEYELIDSGAREKLEQFGPYRLIRPCPVALWGKKCSKQLWQEADASFHREEEREGWRGKKLPESWLIEYLGLKFKIKPTDFGHLGLFPEHALHWDWMESKLEKKSRVLNLFAYSGAATIALAKKGVEVCHLDASKGMVHWAKENAFLNHLKEAKIRYIIDDALKFLKREEKRQSYYDAIILDPPSFGRGSKKEVFKIEEDVLLLLHLCKKVLSKNPQFFLFTSHTPSFTPALLSHLLQEIFPKEKGKIEGGEMLLPSQYSYSLPAGTYARWSS